ncbi:helix-turn-helix domain-containing protein [Sulfitobacter sp. DSM 110093]|uniref:helix-turn-helix domain-containing protein n=1 Tax=Sulfitobacter sp. DSM 110093 TaxID=2883127 RepID=UPI001FAE00AF|nr:helix-turn-helix domain-containing protein [Sulfitobacter sp. DSM 110093]
MTEMHTPAQAAKIANVSRSTVSRAIKSGDLPARKGNQSWQISDSDLREWLGVQKSVQRTRAGHVHAQMDMEQVAKISGLETENRMLLENLRKAEARVDRLEVMLGERWWHSVRDWMRKDVK